MNDNPQVSATELADVIAAELISVRDTPFRTDSEKARERMAIAALSDRIGNNLFGPDTEAKNTWLRTIGAAAPRESN